MSSTLESFLLLVAILAASALMTHFFARAMYLTCPRCRTLNARRRVQCRNCGWELRRAISTDNSK
jgi:hypothetical protein